MKMMSYTVADHYQNEIFMRQHMEAMRYQVEQQVRYEMERRYQQPQQAMVAGMYADPNSMSVRTSHQDREIASLQNQLKEKDVKKKQGLKSLIAHYYNYKK
jgi:hypothetical protein